MTSAALGRQSARDTTDDGLNLYLRAVWARLATGALFAALAAWIVATVPFLRSSILIEAREASIGLSLIGVALAASPLLIWAMARLFARAPNVINPVWYWPFAVSVGAASNTLAMLFMRHSVVSVFVLAAAGFICIHLAHRLVRQTPSWAAALIFITACVGGEWVINAVLDGAWPFIALDLAAIGLFALLIAVRAGAFARIREALPRPDAKAGVTYAAMHLINLAEARAPQSMIKKEAMS